RKLRGLYHLMPHTATLAIVASAAMAGVPFLNGFISKEMFFAETLMVGSSDNWWMPLAAVTMGVFSVAYSLRFINVFFGKPARGRRSPPRGPRRWMRVPGEVLVVFCRIVGSIPGLGVGPLLHNSVQSVLGDMTPYYSLALWHGFNIPV